MPSARRAPASLLYADDLVTAFLDRSSVTPGHLVVVPNGHFTFLAELPDGLPEHILRVGMRLADALRSSGVAMRWEMEDQLVVKRPISGA